MTYTVYAHGVGDTAGGKGTFTGMETTENLAWSRIYVGFRKLCE